MFTPALRPGSKINCCDNWDEFTNHFLFGTQGHVIDHALKCKKNITWIPTTRHVEKVKFSFIKPLTLIRCKGIRLEWH